MIAHKDRLLRFGAELVFAVCAAQQAEVVIVNRSEDAACADDLAQDVPEIVASFSARLHVPSAARTGS